MTTFVLVRGGFGSGSSIRVCMVATIDVSHGEPCSTYLPVLSRSCDR